MHQTCKYSLRLAETEYDLRRAQAMRAGQFGAKVVRRILDADAFDANYQHVLITERETDEIYACFRFMHFKDGSDVDQSYSSQFYDLQRLITYRKPMLEVGRFCLKGGIQDQDLLRIAWAYLTSYVDRHDIAFLFGCSSFDGVDNAKYTDAFALLKEHYLAPERWKPQVKAGEVFEFAKQLKCYKPALRSANQNIPPLLRTYLGMGGWVSDHAVVDRALGTLHVFTGLEVDAIPASRARLFRASAQAITLKSA